MMPLTCSARGQPAAGPRYAMFLRKVAPGLIWPWALGSVGEAPWGPAPQPLSHPPGRSLPSHILTAFPPSFQAERKCKPGLMSGLWQLGLYLFRLCFSIRVWNGASIRYKSLQNWIVHPFCLVGHTGFPLSLPFPLPPWAFKQRTVSSARWI